MGFSKKDSVLVGQVTNFSTVLAASPATYNQSAGTATAVTAAVDTYVGSVNALVEARANGVRSEAQTATRNSNRLTMLNLLRPIYAAVQNSTSISAANKIALGVHVKENSPTPQPVPDFAPLLSVAKVNGRVVTLIARDPNEPTRKGRPAYVSGISFFSHVGETAPAEASQFKFEANTGRMTIDVEFGSSVATGARVWFSAFYFNNRKQSGPASSPISAMIGAGSTMPMTAA